MPSLKLVGEVNDSHYIIKQETNNYNTLPIYNELLENNIRNFNLEFERLYSIYKSSDDLEKELKNELDLFSKISRLDYNYYVISKKYNSMNGIIQHKLLKDKIDTDLTMNATNIINIKNEIDTIFKKYLSNTTKSDKDKLAYNVETPIYKSPTLESPPNNYSNSEINSSDVEFLDKIVKLLPDNKEVLLKNIVKEVFNGSARGLSDYVILFQKYGDFISKKYGLEYIQRKGCHFLLKKNIE